MAHPCLEALRLPMLFTLLAACGSNSAPPPASNAPPIAPAANGPCDLSVTGPLASTVLDPKPTPAPTGGFLPDGTYDLAQLVVTCATPSDQLGATPLRGAYRSVTTEQSSNHQAGNLFVASGGPTEPAKCEAGRFAVFGHTMQVSTERGATSLDYSVTPDGFLIFSPAGGKCDPHVLVYRRRQ